MSYIQNSLVDRCVRVVLNANSNGYSDLPLPEQITAALVLNRHDWLATIGVTIAEAIEIVDSNRLAIMAPVQCIVQAYLEGGSLEALLEAREMEGC